MDPRHPGQNSYSRHSRHLFDPRQNFIDPRNPRNPRKFSTYVTHATHATHEPTQPRNLADSTEHNKRRNFLQKSSRKWGRETSSRPLFVFQKSSTYEVKVNGLQLTLVLNLAYNKNRLDFDFSEKYLELIFPPHFAYNSSRKMFLMLYSTNRPDFIT